MNERIRKLTEETIKGNMFVYEVRNIPSLR